MPEPKKHHLIPRTYMKPWCFSNHSIHTASKENPSSPIDRSIENIANTNKLYTIQAGMIWHDKEELDQIFKPLDGYKVVYNDVILLDSLELNNNYSNFDNWVIFYPNGVRAKNRQMKALIDAIHINSIEEKWSSLYENDWSSIRAKIENTVLHSNSELISEFDREYLIDFMVMLDWRSDKSNDEFQDVYQLYREILEPIEFEKDKNSGQKGFIHNASDEMLNSILLRIFKEFLNKKGVMYNHALQLKQEMSFVFKYPEGSSTFISSDNPVFKFKNSDDLYEYILPISPKVVMQMGRKANSSMYRIEKISDEQVQYYNNQILLYSDEFIVFDDPQIKHF